MNSGSSAFMRSGSQVAAGSSTTASYQRSRGICMSTAAPVWRTTSTVSTELVPGSFKAASTLPLSGTFLPPRRPSSAVMISLAAAVVDAIGDRVRREAAEHHRMHRADARAGEHRHRGFGNHRQVDGDDVALGHAERAQRVGEAAHARCSSR
jgi:hypothetical protein